MSLKKFAKNDVVINTMKAYPSCKFFVYENKIYYNNIPQQSGAFSNAVLNVSSGFVSLYEYNIDRYTYTNASDPLINGFVRPFISASSDRYTFNTLSVTGAASIYAAGEVLTSSYPLSASITRELMTPAGVTTTTLHGDPDLADCGVTTTTPTYRHYYALHNVLEYNGIRNPNYKVLGPLGASGYAWNKDLQNINLISIPSIFYGSQIKPGTVSLKWYYTGSIIGELKDIKQDGTLIQISPYGSTGSGSVAGVVLYDHGFVLLTGSWSLSSNKLPLVSGSTATSDRVNPSWLYFGAGANDDVTSTTTTAAGLGISSASFDLSFKGTSETQVMTVFAHARRGEANYSNNPTFLDFGQEQMELTSSRIYEENSSRTIYNAVSSSYKGYQAPFKRQVYISKIAIYDDKKNFVGVASLANPILKRRRSRFHL